MQEVYIPMTCTSDQTFRSQWKTAELCQTGLTVSGISKKKFVIFFHWNEEGWILKQYFTSEFEIRVIDGRDNSKYFRRKSIQIFLRYWNKCLKLKIVCFSFDVKPFSTKKYHFCSTLLVVVDIIESLQCIIILLQSTVD